MRACVHGAAVAALIRLVYKSPGWALAMPRHGEYLV